jgi:hypothetical protein
MQRLRMETIGYIDMLTGIPVTLVLKPDGIYIRNLHYSYYIREEKVNLFRIMKTPRFVRIRLGEPLYTVRDGKRLIYRDLTREIWSSLQSSHS